MEDKISHSNSRRQHEHLSIMRNVWCPYEDINTKLNEGHEEMIKWRICNSEFIYMCVCVFVYLVPIKTIIELFWKTVCEIHLEKKTFTTS